MTPPTTTRSRGAAGLRDQPWRHGSVARAMDLVEALRTTGAVRAFRPDPVPDEVLARVLDTARFAPSGGNRQAWVVVVKDPAIRRGLRDLYLPGWYEYLAQRAAGLTPWAPVTDEAAEAEAVAGAAGAAADFTAARGVAAERFAAVA